MKLVWLTINSSWSHSSLALPLLHTACRQCKEWQWEKYAGTIKDDPGTIACKISGMAPDLVCASVYIFNRAFVLEVLERVRVLLPHVRIAIGGPECLGGGAAEIVEKCHFIDYACRGEGETIMPSLLAAIAGDEDGEKIPGVVSRAHQDESEPQIYEDWMQAPMPCLDEFYDFSKSFVQVETSRGCPNHCTFCTSAGTAVRYRSLEAVRQEMMAIRQHGIREIRLLDRTFNLPPSRAVELLQMFRTEFADMHFHLEFNPCLLPQVVREELAAAKPGQLHIEAGMQSMHPEVLDAIGRVNTCEKAIEGLAFLCSQKSIVVHSDLISGLPQQTLPGLFADVRRMSEIGPGEIQLEVLKILKGTVLEKEAERLGMKYASMAPYDVMSTPWMSPEDILISRYLSRLVDLYYNAESLQPVFRLCLEQPGFLEDFLAYGQANGLDLGPAPSLKKRFLWLYEYLKDKKLPEVMDELRIAWMKEAFGAVGPCADARLTEHSGNIAWPQLSGAEQDRFDREAKYYRLACSDGRTLIFVYHRGIAPNKAVAVYQAQ